MLARLTEERMETVLLSTSAEPTGHERLVVAFRDGNDLFVPLDGDRPANDELLDASELYVRQVHNQDELAIYQVEGHQVISTRNRQLLERYAHRPISVTTEVLHISGSHVAVGQLRNEPPGFVAVIDGSERAVLAVGPAVALADWYGRPCTVVEVRSGTEDRDTHSAVELQLEGTRLDMHDVVVVNKVDLEATLFDLMRQGQVVVASGFGVWALDGRLHGMLNGLVRHNAPAVIGVGPNVPHDWEPTAGGPIVVCVDDSSHADDMIDKLDPFLCPNRGRVVVLHVDAEPSSAPTAQRIADQVQQRFGIPAEAQTVVDDSVAGAIATFASRSRAQLVITKSWHRPEPGHPVVSSTSLSSVAHVPCPVVILGPQTET